MFSYTKERHRSLSVSFRNPPIIFRYTDLLSVQVRRVWRTQHWPVSLVVCLQQKLPTQETLDLTDDFFLVPAVLLQTYRKVQKFRTQTYTSKSIYT